MLLSTTFKRDITNLGHIIVESCQIIPLSIFAFFCSFLKKKIDVGIGPDPLINNIYHKKALLIAGYSAETFCVKTTFITKNFDFNFDKPNSLLNNLYSLLLRPVFAFTVIRYKVLFIYFNGGPLYHNSILLWRIEPILFRLAKVKIVLLPYGSDVQDLTRTKNLFFKHTVCQDYPNFKFTALKIRKKIDLWTRHADHIFAGCDWVEYLYHWDTLMVSHFCIDTQNLLTSTRHKKKINEPFKILHAPNHKNIKGTKFLCNAIENLQAKGLNIELNLIEKKPNELILDAIKDCDLVADQFVIGWYAMFAIEAMSLGKPVLCYLREDFLELYQNSGEIEAGEIPIVNCKLNSIETTIEKLFYNRDELIKIGSKGIKYVCKYHSLEYVGKKFQQALNSLILSRN
jgi:glycosyltransferase involved in cell wall biosynthesis